MNTINKPGHIDETQLTKGGTDLLTRVATTGQPLIVTRDGADFVALVPLELIPDILALRKAEELASSIDLPSLAMAFPPPQDWLEAEEPKPF